MAKPIYEFDIIALAFGYSYDSPNKPSGEHIEARFIGRTNMTISGDTNWPRQSGDNYFIEGDQVRCDVVGDFPRFVIGIKLDF